MISPLKKNQVSGFPYIHKVVQPSSLSNYRIFSSPQKETLYPLAVTPIPALPNPHYWQPLIYFCLLIILYNASILCPGSFT